MRRAVSTPESSHFQAVFDQFTANAKVPGNLQRGLPLEHKLPQRGIRNQRSRTRCIRRFFIDFPVISRNGPTAMIFRLDIQAASLVAQEDVRNLFHQSRVCAHRRMRWIKNDYASPIGKWLRRCSSRPGVCSLTQQVLSRLLAQAFDLFKVEDEEIRKFG